MNIQAVYYEVYSENVYLPVAFTVVDDNNSVSIQPIAGIYNLGIGFVPSYIRYDLDGRQFYASFPTLNNVLITYLGLPAIIYQPNSQLHDYSVLNQFDANVYNQFANYAVDYSRIKSDLHAFMIQNGKFYQPHSNSVFVKNITRQSGVVDSTTPDSQSSQVSNKSIEEKKELSEQDIKAKRIRSIQSKLNFKKYKSKEEEIQLRQELHELKPDKYPVPVIEEQPPEPEQIEDTGIFTEVNYEENHENVDVFEIDEPETNEDISNTVEINNTFPISSSPTDNTTSHTEVPTEAPTEVIEDTKLDMKDVVEMTKVAEHRKQSDMEDVNRILNKIRDEAFRWGKVKESLDDVLDISENTYRVTDRNNNTLKFFSDKPKISESEKMLADFESKTNDYSSLISNLPDKGTNPDLRTSNNNLTISTPVIEDKLNTTAEIADEDIKRVYTSAEIEDMIAQISQRANSIQSNFDEAKKISGELNQISTTDYITSPGKVKIKVDYVVSRLKDIYSSINKSNDEEQQSNDENNSEIENPFEMLSDFTEESIRERSDDDAVEEPTNRIDEILNVDNEVQELQPSDDDSDTQESVEEIISNDESNFDAKEPVIQEPEIQEPSIPDSIKDILNISSLDVEEPDIQEPEAQEPSIPDSIEDILNILPSNVETAQENVDSLDLYDDEFDPFLIQEYTYDDEPSGEEKSETTPEGANTLEKLQQMFSNNTKKPEDDLSDTKPKMNIQSSFMSSLPESTYGVEYLDFEEE